ncbi:DnaJ C-terminal domain-containing protein [Legionella impletisoli]|uniref:Cytochrome c biogenesis protein n=1 Tax=Legionella impletisoli TaxID=343510 RepID=A0A917NE02_9GAMM|nr:DnaJ C-terminal domain-containing protein [Legionella impletisoli]GGI88600.1 cytochrome c biogenesis protein [Legionella impletisoli]
MAKKDYYHIMGLKSDASEKEIKMAYRRLARKYHPDISKEPQAEEKFKELGEAYEVLKDPEKRKLYDQYGMDWEQGPRAGQTSQQYTWQGAGPQQGFSFDEDFFESIFGGHQRRERQQPAYKGADYHSEIHISLEEAYKGTVKELKIPAAVPGQKSQTLRVKIPSGVKSGQQIRLSGKGGPGFGGGEKGDLYLKVHLEKHPYFDVKEKDVYLTLPITPWEAALGATIPVPTLGGKVDLKIPSDSQAGQKLRLKQRGMPGTPPGDQYVILKIMIPEPKTELARELYQKMAEEMPFNPREKMRV